MNYRIQRGDTLSALARRFGTSVQALANANGIRNVNLIYAGANLRVPGRNDSYQRPASRPASSPSSTPSAPVSSSQFGSRAATLASTARSMAQSMNTRGWCARGVANSLERMGLAVPRQPSAYMYSNVLSRDPRFREVRVSQAQMRNLPPGAIIVHPSGYRGAGSPHGHIAVTLGNGMEASDHVRSLITSPNARVFIPR